MMMYGGFGHFGWIGMILQLVITIGIIAGFVILVVWAVRRAGGSSAQAVSQNPGSPSAKDILQARYARGEINRDEYQQILSDLGS